jgi:hypothetical protein
MHNDQRLKEIAMSFARKSIARLLALVPMVLIVHTGTAAAASPMNDRAEELRALLSGRPVLTSAPAITAGNPKAARSIGDAQQQAREVLLAISPRTLSVSRSYASKPSRERVHADAQAQAQQVILGHVFAAKAGA